MVRNISKHYKLFSPFKIDHGTFYEDAIWDGGATGGIPVESIGIVVQLHIRREEKRQKTYNF